MLTDTFPFSGFVCSRQRWQYLSRFPDDDNDDDTDDDDDNDDNEDDHDDNNDTGKAEKQSAAGPGCFKNFSLWLFAKRDSMKNNIEVRKF